MTLAGAPGGGLGDGCTAEVMDFSQDMEFTLVIQHEERLDEELVPAGFVLLQQGQALDPKLVRKGAAFEAVAQGSGSAPAPPTASVGGTKRPAPDCEAAQPPSAKAARQE